MKTVYFQDWGLIDYQAAWDKQEALFAETVRAKTENRTKDKKPDTKNRLIFCEHPHVYTLGRNGKAEHLLLDEDRLAQREASFYKINRGGDITYHGPGQLVGYPIFDLDHFFTDIHQYLRYLEEAIILTLSHYGIQAGRIKGLTGVWLNPDHPRKICAMGVRCSRWVTMHGFALNVNVDLNYFHDIIPCGLNKGVTSMNKELNRQVDMTEVKQILKAKLCERFSLNLINDQ